MLCMRPAGVLLLLSLLAVACAGLQPTTHQNPLDHDRHDAATADLDDLVRELADESVKAALHDHLAPKYREGVFEGGKKAIETIRQESPELVSKVIDAAMDLEGKNDLKKRQSGANSTSSSSSSSPSPASSSVPVSFGSSSTTSSPSSSSSQAITSSSVPPSTTTSTTTHRPVVTSTHTHGKTIVYTYTPSTTHVTTVIHRTTKLPNGSTSTYTSYKVVPATPSSVASIKPEGDGHPSAGRPNLQTGDAARTGGYAGELAALFGVALGVAALI